MQKILLAVLLAVSPLFAEEKSYTGSSETDKGAVEVRVDIDNDKIKAVKVLESKGYPKFIFNKMIRNIVKENKVDTDALSGATTLTRSTTTSPQVCHRLSLSNPVTN